jgi:thiol-disulfide isomerase/thioredoxin
VRIAALFRPFFGAFTVVAFLSAGVFADDKPAAKTPTPSKGAETFETVKNEFQEASKAYSVAIRAAYEEARKNNASKGFKFDKPSPAASFSPRFLAIAEKNPEGPDAIDAITYALATSDGPTPESPLETRVKAIKILRDHYVDKPQIKALMKTITWFDDDASKGLVAEVIARNPDRGVQAAAYQGQASYREWVANFIDIIKDAKRLETIEKTEGKAFVKARLARAEKARAELETLTKILREKYSDLVNDLSIGRPMPALVSEDLEGKTVTLGDLKGKVVVFDIWATWCGPCKAMIPHEREMVERLKDKPFALVSISFDAEKKTLVDFLAREKMPWNHWWNGSEGKLMDTLNIEHYPTIFVLDPSGVIRFKEIRGEALEKAVNTLLDEMKAKPRKDQHL